MFTIFGIGLILSVTTGPAGGQEQLRKKVDSLFVVASSGEVKYRNLVQPAIDSLASIGVPAVPFLIDKLGTKSARERVTLLNIFKKIGSPSVPLLVSSLNNDDGLAVERICNMLGEIGDSSAVAGLTGVAHHPRWRVREEAIGSLGKLRSPRANSAVEAALDDSIGQVRKSAAVSCGQLKIRATIPQLVHMLGDDFYGARLCAADALLLLDTSAVVPVLADSMNSANPLVGNLGCRILGQLATPKATELLLQQTRSVDRSRRAHASVALVNADPKDRTGFQAKFKQTETDPLVKVQIESAIAAKRREH